MEPGGVKLHIARLAVAHSVLLALTFGFTQFDQLQGEDFLIQSRFFKLK